MIGRELGTYRVLDKLGEGGMGEVYRARDTRLDRDVAIKVLPQLFARDAERLARFTREAHTLAALNHPNIAAIYGTGNRGRRSARDGTRRRRGSLGHDRARADAARRGARDRETDRRGARDGARAGHRPSRFEAANIKVRPDGAVKVLDFGLAKATDPNGASDRREELSTLTARATQLGTIIGKARTWRRNRRAARPSIGAPTSGSRHSPVKMLQAPRVQQRRSFRRPRGGAHAGSGSVRASRPTRAAVRRLIDAASSSIQKRRLRDIGEARLILEGRTRRGPSPLRRRRHRRAGCGPSRSRLGPLPQSPARPAGSAGTAGQRACRAPLGRAAARRASDNRAADRSPMARPSRPRPDGRGRVASLLAKADAVTARAVDSSSGALYPFSHPMAGHRVSRRQTLARSCRRRRREPHRARADAVGWHMARGRADCFVPNSVCGLWRVPADGGSPSSWPKPTERPRIRARVPAAPRRHGGRALQVGAMSFHGEAVAPGREADTWSDVSPRRSAVNTDTRGVNTGTYVAGGYMLAGDSAGGMRAARWTPDSATPASPETAVLDDVYWIPGTQHRWFHASATGTAIYVPGSPARRHLVWVDRQGQVSQLPGEPDQIDQGTVSRDGRRVVYSGRSAQWTLDLATGVRTRILADVSAWHGAWLPGDERIVVSTSATGDWELYTVAAGGRAEPTPILKRPFAQHAMAVTPDGAVVFLERHPVTGSDLWVLSPDGRTTPLVVTPYNESAAAVSADGTVRRLHLG